MEDHSNDDAKVDDIVKSGPGGAIVLASIATAIVIGMWFVFYFAVFLPRGTIH